VHGHKTCTVHVTAEMNWSDQTIMKYRNPFAVFNACLVEMPVIRIWNNLRRHKNACKVIFSKIQNFWEHKMHYMIEQRFRCIKYKSIHPDFMEDSVWLSVICAMAWEWGKLACKTCSLIEIHTLSYFGIVSLSEMFVQYCHKHRLDVVVRHKHLYMKQPPSHVVFEPFNLKM
jgi:hypothetical protein